MGTASEIVTGAYRAGNLIAIGTSANADQLTEGLDALNGYLDSLLGFELGEFALEWAVAPRNNAPVQSRFPLLPQDTKLGSNTYPYPPPNARVLINVTEAASIWMPPSPADGARIALVNLASSEVTITLNGNGHTLDGSFTVTGLPSELAGRSYFYRADQGDWKSFTELSADDTPVLPSVYDYLLSLGTLSRLLGRYGRSLTGDQQAEQTRLLRRLKSQYRQPTPAEIDKDRVFTVPLADYRSKGMYNGGGLL